MKQIIYFILIVLSFENVLAQSRSGTGLGIYFEETFFPKYVNENDTASITTSPGVADETGLGFDTRTTVGFLMLNQSLLLGMSYNYYSLTTERDNVSGGDPGLKETTKEYQFGPTFGYLSGGGFRTLLTFFLGGQRTKETINFNGSGDTANATIKNSGLQGFQLTLGYSFAIWGVEIGPSLVYSSKSYSKQTNKDKLTPANDYTNRSLYSKSIDTELEPMLSILVLF